MRDIKEFRKVNGINISYICTTEAIISALNYKPKPGDIFVTGYPRCGNTWLQYIVLLILRKGQVSGDPLEFFLGCPYIEWFGGDCVDYISKPAVIGTHIPFHSIPYSPEAKYIYINRNPRDCFISHYQLRKETLEEENKTVSLDDYFDDFIQGNIIYGDYFDHVIEWYKHKNNDNVHFVTYENLKKDIHSEILKIAKFIGEEYEKSILEDQEIMENILYYSSFEYMKKNANKSYDMIFRCGNAFESREMPSGLKASLQNILSQPRRHPITEFVRKGVVGDWRNYFKEDHIKRLEAKIEEKTTGTDIKMLWKDSYDQ